MKEKTKLSMKEKLIVGGFFLVIFLPVRLVFFTYVSDHWFGSLGVLSLTLVAIIYLSYKQKLGYLGRLIIKQLNHIKYSRLVAVAFTVKIFMIIAFTCAFIGMSFGGDSSYVAVVDQMFVDEGVDSVDDILTIANPELGLLDYIFTALFLFILPFVDFELFSGMMYSIDQLSGGWISHFIAISLIELIEVFTIMVYFKFIRKGDI